MFLNRLRFKIFKTSYEITLTQGRSIIDEVLQVLCVITSKQNGLFACQNIAKLPISYNNKITFLQNTKKVFNALCIGYTLQAFTVMRNYLTINFKE